MNRHHNFRFEDLKEQDIVPVYRVLLNNNIGQYELTEEGEFLEEPAPAKLNSNVQEIVGSPLEYSHSMVDDAIRSIVDTLDAVSPGLLNEGTMSVLSGRNNLKQILICLIVDDAYTLSTNGFAFNVARRGQTLVFDRVVSRGSHPEGLGIPFQKLCCDHTTNSKIYYFHSHEVGHKQYVTQSRIEAVDDDGAPVKFKTKKVKFNKKNHRPYPLSAAYYAEQWATMVFSDINTLILGKVVKDDKTETSNAQLHQINLLSLSDVARLGKVNADRTFAMLNAVIDWIDTTLPVGRLATFTYDPIRDKSSFILTVQ